MIKKGILNFLASRGYFITPQAHLPHGVSLHSDLEKLGWATNDKRVIFDVGANIGEFTNDLVQRFQKSIYHCFEPDPRLYKQLSNRFLGNDHIFIVQKGCGESEQTETLFLNENSTINSIVPRNFQKNTTVRTETIDIITLSNYLENTGLEKIDLLKIDVEGFEMQVLRGLKEHIARVSLVLVESRFSDYTLSGTRFEQINDFMTQNGFEFFCLYDYTAPQKQRFDYGDVLFVNVNAKR